MSIIIDVVVHSWFILGTEYRLLNKACAVPSNQNVLFLMFVSFMQCEAHNKVFLDVTSCSSVAVP